MKLKETQVIIEFARGVRITMSSIKNRRNGAPNITNYYYYYYIIIIITTWCKSNGAVFVCHFLRENRSCKKENLFTSTITLCQSTKDLIRNMPSLSRGDCPKSLWHGFH